MKINTKGIIIPQEKTFGSLLLFKILPPAPCEKLNAAAQEDSACQLWISIFGSVAKSELSQNN